MAIESASDLAGFFDVDEFGVSAALNSRTVSGIFMNGYEDAGAGLFGGGVEIESNRPVFMAPTSDVDDTSLDTDSNNAVVIATVSYIAVSIQPDGTGLTVIELIEAS